MSPGQRLRILSITTEPLEVPLVDPVIATARVDVTRSVLVPLRWRGRKPGEGLGEAALQPITHESPADVHGALRGIAPALLRRSLAAPTIEGFAALVGGALDRLRWRGRLGRRPPRRGGPVEGRHLVSFSTPRSSFLAGSSPT